MFSLLELLRYAQRNVCDLEWVMRGDAILLWDWKVQVGATHHWGKARGSRRHGASAGSPVFQREQVGNSHMPDGNISPLFGALDLGTNNCRLLIAAISESGFKVHDAFSRIVRLGEGLGHNGALSEAAMDRTIEALRVCANKLIWHKVKNRRLIATEACRIATNGEAFIARVKSETGLLLEIVDRETEARLAAAGAGPLIDKAAESALIFDIGGGSTEIMWVDQQGNVRNIVAWTSIAAGVVTLSERYGGGVDVTEASFRAMRGYVRPLLLSFAQQVSALKGNKIPPSHLLGTSGTVTTIAGVHMGLRRYDRARVDGCWLLSEDVGKVTENLLSMGYRDRTQNPCIGKERADLVMAGCAILEEIRLAFPSAKIRVADRGLREGILAQLMADYQNRNEYHE